MIDRRLFADVPQPAADELLTLESEALRIKIWPRMGGKIVSIVVRGHGSRAGYDDRELLHPPIHPYKQATANSGFEDSDAGGWDECFPSVAACTVNGIDIPDHGDVWRKPWTASVKHDALSSHVTASSMPMRFSRWLSLDGPTMHLRYSVTNTGNAGADFLWSAHPLFQVQAGDRIVLPEGVHEVHVEASSADRLEAGDRSTWPLAALTRGGYLDLSLVGPEDGVTSHKLFAGPLSTGWCGLYRSALQMGIIMRFDPGHTPFAGLWISQGAWPKTEDDSPTRARQYAVALEPTTAPCDSLQHAIETGHAQHLQPLAELSWPVQFEVFGSHTAIRYEDFLAMASIAPRH